MIKLGVFNQNGEKASEVEIASKLLSGPVRKALLWESIKMQQANHRSGTAATKTRGAVSGSTRKIYRQKGTGNARHGDIKAPVFVGGGQTFGPQVRDYSYRIPTTARKAALVSAITYKFKESKLKVIDTINFEKIKTKDAQSFFQKLGVDNALLVIEGKNENVEKSVRNLRSHKVIRVEGINPLDILKYDHLVLTQSAIKKIEEIV